MVPKHFHPSYAHHNTQQPAHWHPQRVWHYCKCRGAHAAVCCGASSPMECERLCAQPPACATPAAWLPPAEHGSSATTAAAAAGAALTSSHVQQAGGDSTNDQAEAGSTVCLGSFTGLLKQTSDGCWVVKQLQDNRQLNTYDTAHQVVLAERVLGSDSPTFKVHIQPGQPDTRNNTFAQATSHAGHGMGLQVFPGSIAEVVHAGNIQLIKGKYPQIRVMIPRLLVCSQLLVDTVYPLEVSLRVVDEHSGSAGSDVSWKLNLLAAGIGRSYRVVTTASHPLSVYVGRIIARMSLTECGPDRQLTLYLAPLVGSALEASAASRGAGDTQAATQAADPVPSAATASQHPDSSTELEPLTTAGTMQPGRKRPAKVHGPLRATAVQDVPADMAAAPNAEPAQTTPVGPPPVGSILLGSNSPDPPLPTPHSTRAPGSSAVARRPILGTGGPASQHSLVPADTEAEKPAASPPAAAPPGPGAAAAVTGGANRGVTKPGPGLMLASNQQQELLSVALALSAAQQPAPPMRESGAPRSSNPRQPRMMAPLAADTASNQPPPPAAAAAAAAAAAGQYPVTPCAGLTPSKRLASCMADAIKQEQPEGGLGTVVSSSHMSLQAPALQVGLLQVVKQEGGGSGAAGADTAAAGPAAVNKKPRLPPQSVFQHQMQQQHQQLLLQPALVSPPGVTMAQLGHQQHQSGDQRQACEAPTAIHTVGQGTTHKMAAVADFEMMEAAAVAGHGSVAAATQQALGPTVEPGTIGTGAGQRLLTVPGRLPTPRAVAASLTGRTPRPAGPLAPAAPAAQPTTKQVLPQEGQSSKQVTVFDLTADSDEELEGNAMQQQMQHDAELLHTAAPPAAATVFAAPAQAAYGAQGQQVAAGAPSSLPPAPAAAPASGQLPSGLQLQDADSPRTMEQQLVRFMRQGLRDVLPREQYCGLMDQLLGFFEPLRQQGALADADQQEQLQCMYTYVQAAVDGGQLKSVLTALKALIAAGS